MSQLSHYDTLGLDPSATKEQVRQACLQGPLQDECKGSAQPAQVKQAYRQKALRYHPDLSDEEDARQRFVSVTEAYGE